MHQLHFPKRFEHTHPPVRSVNDIETEQLTLGQRAADRVAAIVGSWRFIGLQSLVLTGWACINVVAWTHHWDPYPFILMNLFLSLQAAYTAPMLMMSQNRMAARDRLEAHNDYLINRKAEEEVRAVLDHLSAQDEALTKIIESLVGTLEAGSRPPGPGAAAPR
ncbi:MAG TPA: DUF1003 domain-containing protein [Vicinamibacterales bacterium]|nr:DUF1003 domain-containing protein [Vicinamibacterales bacterium]HPW19809.1 DUF1003 domain-containing protein [Vicinamibacterales bacterium]